MPARRQKGKQPRTRGASARVNDQVASDNEIEDADVAGPSRALRESPVPSEDESKSKEYCSDLDMSIDSPAAAIKYDAHAG